MPDLLNSSSNSRKDNLVVYFMFKLFLYSRWVVSDSCDPMTVAHQALLTMEFSRQEYWSEGPFPTPGDLPNPGIQPVDWQVDSLPLVPPESLSVQFSRSVVSDSLRPHGLQHARPPCPSPTPRIWCPLSRWCHPTISSSVIFFCSLQSFPASGSFLMTQLFISGG